MKTNLTKNAVDILARSHLLHCVLNRYGIEIIPGTAQIRTGDHGQQVEFGIVPVSQEKDHNYRTLLKKRSVIHVQKLTLVVACLPMHDEDHLEENGQQLMEDSDQKQEMFEMAVCNATDELLNNLVCERKITFGKWLQELCVADVLIPSIACSVNSGMDMLLKSQITNSGCCSQQIVEAILVHLGQSQVQELALEERPIIQEGIQIVLQSWFEKRQRRKQRSQVAP